MASPFPERLPDWRRAFGGPPGRARLREQPEDFRVTEILDLELAGEGEHDWLSVEKRGANTAWVASRLARHAGVPRRDVGYAGLKDRHAVTRQWFSVRRPAARAPDWSAFRAEGVTLLETARHRRKLRRGAHRGNRFAIRLAGWRGDPAPVLSRIAGEGVPNYFGEQRFGRDAGNLVLARALLAGERLRREARSHALSAARSFVFNAVLDRRVAEGSWNRLLEDEVVMLEGTHSHFVAGRPDAALEERCARLDVHPSGPLPGRGAAPGPAPEREVLASVAAVVAGLERFADADRRALRLRVANLRWALSGDSIELEFDLPAGAFATAVLREIADYSDASRT